MKSTEIVLLLPIGILVTAFVLRLSAMLIAAWWRERQLQKAFSRRMDDRDDDPPLAI